ncbi:MAG: hypothetical protein P1U63_04290 [Coxiellaceae bacterium]|nr:hypothetical protein [Coxiellaceae bacterium]
MTRNAYDFDQTATNEHTFADGRIESFLAIKDVAERLAALDAFAKGSSGAGNMRADFVTKALSEFTPDNPLLVFATHHNNPFFQLLCMKYAIEARGVSFEFQENDTEQVVNAANEYTAVTLYKVIINGQEGAVAISHVNTTEDRPYIFDNPGLALDGKNVQLQHLHAVLSGRDLMPGDTRFNLYDDGVENCEKAKALPIVDQVFQVTVGGPDFIATPYVSPVAEAPAVPVPPVSAEVALLVLQRVNEELKAYASVRGLDLNRGQAEFLARSFPGRPILRYSPRADSMVVTYLDAAGVCKHDTLSESISGNPGMYSTAAAVIDRVQEVHGAVVASVEAEPCLITADMANLLAAAHQNIRDLFAGVDKAQAIAVAPTYPENLIVRDSSQAGAFAITVSIGDRDVRHVLLDDSTIKAKVLQLQTVEGAKQVIAAVCGGRDNFVTSAMAQAVLNPAVPVAAGGMFGGGLRGAQDPAQVDLDPAHSDEDPRPPTPPS